MILRVLNSLKYLLDTLYPFQEIAPRATELHRLKQDPGQTVTTFLSTLKFKAGECDLKLKCKSVKQNVTSVRKCPSPCSIRSPRLWALGRHPGRAGPQPWQGPQDSHGQENCQKITGHKHYQLVMETSQPTRRSWVWREESYWLHQLPAAQPRTVSASIVKHATFSTCASTEDFGAGREDSYGGWNRQLYIRDMFKSKWWKQARGGNNTDNERHIKHYVIANWRPNGAPHRQKGCGLCQKHGGK